MNQDTEHLRLLTIFHFVVSGLIALFSSFGLIHLSMGLMMLLSPDSFSGSGPGQAPPPLFGLMFAVMGGAIVVGGWSIAAAVFLAGRFLKRRTHYLFCMVVAGLSCMFTPFGTVLGILTILVLMRPSVKLLFDSGSSSPACQGALTEASTNNWVGVRESNNSSIPRQPPDWR